MRPSILDKIGRPPSCIHGVPLEQPDGRGVQCDQCAAIIEEQALRYQFIDGLVRMTEFFQKHPEFIPIHGVMPKPVAAYDE